MPRQESALPTPEQESPEQAGGEHESQSKKEIPLCFHTNWRFGRHGRYCTCGAMMVDWGD